MRLDLNEDIDQLKSVEQPHERCTGTINRTTAVLLDCFTTFKQFAVVVFDSPVDTKPRATIQSSEYPRC
jgi:hypothetical protein